VAWGQPVLALLQAQDCVVVVPIYGVDGVSLWSEEDEVESWQAVEAVRGPPRAQDHPERGI
jgi:hypothetical protein